MKDSTLLSTVVVINSETTRILFWSDELFLYTQLFRKNGILDNGIFFIYLKNWNKTNDINPIK